jgi:GNAT superfamily N-acetyltransferase
MLLRSIARRAAKFSSPQASAFHRKSLQSPLMPSANHPAPGPVETPVPAITVRRLLPTDPIPEITSLLHRAYAKQVAMGLAPLAGRQDDATTLKRVTHGECYLALMDALPREKIVGTILFHEVEDAKGPPWFQQPHVDSFSQFAVDPDIQGRGLGLLMLAKAESRAKECGATELGLSMAEPDTALMAFYLKRGYRFIEHWQWPYTNYRSAILSKTL